MRFGASVAGDSHCDPAPTDAAYSASQLTVVMVALPADGTVLLADDVTAVSAGQRLSVAQLSGLEFKHTAGVYNTSARFNLRGDGSGWARSDGQRGVGGRRPGAITRWCDHPSAQTQSKGTQRRRGPSAIPPLVAEPPATRCIF
jgi:hypothetical protein